MNIQSRKIIAMIFVIAGLSFLGGCSGEDLDSEPRDGFNGAIYEEGIHFKKIKGEAEMLQADVSTFFWFQCPHCNSLRPALEKWRSENPQFSVEHIHSLISQSWIDDQMLYQALKKRGVLEESYDAIFDHIHGDGGGHEKKTIVDILQDAGIDIKEEDLRFSQSEKNEMVKKAKNILEVEKKIGAVGVPYIVVNGKYLIKNESFSSYDEMMHGVGWILKNK